MRFQVIGHPDLDAQVSDVLRADPVKGPVRIARIRAVLESYDEDPSELEPAPVAQQSWVKGVTLYVQGEGDASPRPMLDVPVSIYVYEAWSLRFAIARVQLLEEFVVGAFLMVDTMEAATKSKITSENLSLALLAKAEELTWPN
jgi:hypothetical protein